MSSSFFRQVIDRMNAYVPGLQPPDGDNGYLKLNTNENPYPPSPKVLAAIAKETARLRLYPDPDSTAFRKAAAKLNGVELDCVIVGNGSDDVLTMLCRSVIGPGDRVYFPCPTYSLYDVLVNIQDGVNCPVDFPEDFTLPEGLFGNDGVLTFLANPNSPSGTFISPERIARLAESLNGLLVVDEAYVDFAERDCTVLLDKHRNLVLLRSLSKSYSLAGLRAGYALADAKIIEGLRKVKDSYNLDRLAVAGAAAALEDVGNMRENAVRIRNTRAGFVEGLDKLAFVTLPSEANFVLTSPPEPHIAEQVYQQLWQRNILVRHFKQPRLESQLRITIGTDEQMKTVIDALGEIIT